MQSPIACRLAFAAALAWASPAPAQVQPSTEDCGAYADVTQPLRDTWGETPVLSLLETEHGSLLQVWSAPGGSTWTLVGTTPYGLTCVIAAGVELEVFPPPTIQADEQVPTKP